MKENKDQSVNKTSAVQEQPNRDKEQNPQPQKQNDLADGDNRKNEEAGSRPISLGNEDTIGNP